MRVQPCACFSMCTQHEAAHFRTALLPRSVDHKSSPWWRYLQAVYGSHVPLPFDLHALDFFYHNDDSWRQRHPSAADWPMATCAMEPNHEHTGGAHIHRSQVPPCALEACAPWLRVSVEATRAALETSFDGSIHYFPSSGQPTTAGALYAKVERPAVASHVWMG